MANKITRTTWKESKHYITGVFSFSDKSKTKFTIEKNSGVYTQSGNSFNLGSPVISNNAPGADKVRAALFGYIVDCWLIFTDLGT